jgi:glycosyltransferase involved in cell wall biosynthesis
MEMADVVLVASQYVEDTVRAFHPSKKIARATYGVDLEFWSSGSIGRQPGPLQFIYAGQMSVRKGIPLLLEAWEKAGLRDAELKLVGQWQLSENKRRSLPRNVAWYPPCSRWALRDQYLQSDVMVFPSYSDGFGLVMLEGLACGLPIIASKASGGPEIVTDNCGKLIPTGDSEALIESLRWFGRHRQDLPAMRERARSRAGCFSWSAYRDQVVLASKQFC